MKRTIVFLLASTLLLCSFPVFAETLGYPDIRNLYASIDAAMPDPEKSHNIIKDRFDDNMVLTVKGTRIVGNSLPETSEAKMTKNQVIEADRLQHNISTIKSHRNVISDIKFSDDNRWAYVYNTTTSSGRMNFPVGGGKTLPADYSDSTTCIDTLTLEYKLIKVVKSECKEVTQITHPSD